VAPVVALVASDPVAQGERVQAGQDGPRQPAGLLPCPGPRLPVAAGGRGEELVGEVLADHAATPSSSPGVGRWTGARGSSSGAAPLGKMTGVAVASTAVAPAERLAAALRQPSRLDREIITELEHVTITLEGLESQVSPKALLGPVTGHLDAVTTLLQGSTRPSLRRQLCSIAGETAGLAGWLTWDLEDRKAAGAYFRTGIEAAGEADDRALGAYLVGSSCVQPAYRERPQARLRRLEGHTHGFARADATPSTQAWLVTLEAEAHVLAGDERATLRALDEAEAIMSRSADEATTRRPRVAFFNRAYLDGERGVALARLDKPQAAQDVLAAALASLDPEAMKTRPRLLTALATAHVRQGDIEEACQLGTDALALATQQEVAPNLQDVRKLHRTTVYVTDEQWRWLSRLAAQARLDELPLSASDVIRLAIARLQDQLADDDLRAELIAHVRAEAEQYPGRARRGLPKDDKPQS
jgi:hypothetical protein